MRIMAVIPAKAGSKVIPNQNVRIIAGHPLVYYAIQNARKSKYISDVIVSTDSEEVGIVASQLGVRVKWRDKTLSKDDTSLDTVIYNAIQDEEDYDYVVTLQPTSPLLSVDTLDKAIEYCISKELDTLISVINDPRYSWSEINGTKVPNYTERKDRHLLPANYVETGAFLISKRDKITSKSRIGDNVDVFVVPFNEAYGIDSFESLHIVKFIMQRKKSAIYVNGNNERGMGHVYRSLEIADELYMNPDIYYNKKETDISVFGDTKHKLIAVDGEEELLQACQKEGYSLFINDILDTTVSYMKKLKEALPKAKIVNFEDNGDGILEADIVFNALYSKSMLPYVYAGEKYYIAGRQFLYYEPITIRDDVKNVLVSFGGADPQNYTERLLQIISNDYYDQYDFTVVVGRANPNYENINNYKKDNIHILYDVKNMPELMSKSDMAITSRGRTGYELALMGIPTIAIAQNHREETHDFVSNENGFSYIGLRPADNIIEGNLRMYLSMPKDIRQNFQDIMLSHDLRSGRSRVMGLINNI